MNTIYHNSYKNISKDNLRARSLANVYLYKRRIPRGNNRMEHRQNQATRNQISHNPWYTDLSQDTQLPSIGFDNSDKNKLRNSIGSCTDMIATERRLFGPWQVPNADRQRTLVNRLARHKLPAPADPRFDAWVNHFQHYWNIGVHVKPTRKALQNSTNTAADLKVDASLPESQSEHSHGKLYMTSYHRLLRRRQGTLERLQPTDRQNTIQKDNANESGHVSEKYTNTLGGNLGADYRRKRVIDYERGTLVPGLDRKYLGLQVTDKQHVEDMVKRLTRMTSAYKAKFSPNPHVWIDTSPGAHMVIKRENTIA